jgi:hypothetical protein
LDRLDTLPGLEASSPRERADIMRIQARRIGVQLDYEACLRAFSEAENRIFSGRQIIMLFENARIAARYDDRDNIGYADVKEAIGDALYGFGPKEEFQALMAIEHTGFGKYLPWVAAEHYGDDTASVPSYVLPYMKDALAVDMVKLRNRIKELTPYGR